MMPGVKAAAPAHLTRRERQVLARFLAGRSEKQIALDVGVTTHAVGHHRKSLHRKLDVASRGELLALFVTADAAAIEAIVATRLSSSKSGRLEALTPPKA